MSLAQVIIKIKYYIGILWVYDISIIILWYIYNVTERIYTKKLDFTEQQICFFQFPT